MEDSLNHYEKLIKHFPEIERKGKTMPYTSMNGHMFSFLDKEGNMGLRLSKEDREAFLLKHTSKIMEQHGRQMKEYVFIPTELLKSTTKLKKYFKASVEYVGSLKPKPTKRKKK